MSMNLLIINSKGRILFAVILFSLCIFNSCDTNILEEKPYDLNSDVVLTDDAGFQNYLIALSNFAREEMSMDDWSYSMNFIGTDIGSAAGVQLIYFKNYQTYLNPTSDFVVKTWRWAYTQMILQANTIITYAQAPEADEIWETEAERNAVIAEARFYRAYTYNLLANTYGNAPIVDVIYSEPKVDFVMSSREEIYEFVKQDLEFASQWLPATVKDEGRIVKAAADHLLSEVYISVGEYDNAITSASKVINSGLYKLMTTRFGTKKDEPGDVFSDLFHDGNQNRSSGNLESIYVWQFEDYTIGGSGTYSGNADLRHWAPFLTRLTDKNGIAMLPSDSLNRGAGGIRGSNYLLYDIWQGDWNTDMRNSKYNMRRKFYYNNPKSIYYGQEVEKRTKQEDTLRNIYPYPRKIEGMPWEDDNTSGKTGKDKIVYRLAETYLLRAEAYVRKNMPTEAASDINIVRNRAGASSVQPNKVTLDYILDERARELITEEPRRRTLCRMGNLVERVRKYNMLSTTKTSIQDYHEFYPIPQYVIDANYGAVLEQNPGY